MSDTPTLLRLRADLLARTRAFFAGRDVLEVETPLLAHGLVVDAHIDPVRVVAQTAGGARYLLPSPEAPMKRLLAAGSGPIYAISRAFRAGERGRLHRPEFTMLEWYRPGLDEHALMDEVAALLDTLAGCPPPRRVTYAELFEETLGLHPHAASAQTLADAAAQAGADVSAEDGRDALLNLLLATAVEPRLDPAVPLFVYDFPASQAALAEISAGDPPVARRFELLYRGMELCNGYVELRDAGEHRARFAAANAERIAGGREPIAADEDLCAAAARGLPACAGVAVGFDRVVMLAAGADAIGGVLPLDA